MSDLPEKKVRGPYKPRNERRTESVSFRFTLDEFEALEHLANHCGWTVNQVARTIVRSHLIESPRGVELIGFPPEQSLALWVLAHHENRTGQPPLDPREALSPSKSGKGVVRLDYLTAR